MTTCACISNQKKMLISIQTALIAFVVYNPVLFQGVQAILGNWVASSDGLPTIIGLFIHTVLFGLIVYLLMKPNKLVKNQRQSVSGLPLV